MKRCVAFITAVSVLLCLASCASDNPDVFRFYYCRDPEDYQYFDENSVIDVEYRDIPSHGNDLHYILSLYLAGPMEEGLISPLPESTRLLSVENVPSGLCLTISSLSGLMTDSEFSLACACLALTCADITGHTEVTIISGDRTVTMNPDTIRLTDMSAATATTEGGQS